MFANYLKQNKFFITAIALLHLIFFALACHYKRIYMGDSSEYIYEALNIKNLFFFYSGNPAMPIEPELMTQRQPLYPLLLLLVYCFTINNWIVLVLQNLLSIFNILYCRNVFQKIGYQNKYDWLFAIFIAAYPAQFINANTIAPDILLQTFALLYFGNFICLIQTRQRRYELLMGIALIAGMMVKPVLYPFVIVHFLILILIAIYQKVKLQRTIVLAIMPLCAMLLYNYWNFTRTDKFHFSSNQAFNAVYYYYPFLSSKYGADSATHFLENERVVIASIPEYKDRYDYANQRGIELLKQNFLPYMFFHLKNSFRIFIEPGKGEIDLFTGKLTYGKLYNKQNTQAGFYATIKEQGWGGVPGYIANNSSMPFVILILLFNCIKIIGIILFLKDKRVQFQIKIFALILLLYFAFASGSIANTRYFLPVSLMVSGCALSWIKSSDKRVSIP